MKTYLHERNRRIDGLPAGITFQTLDALCREHGRGGLTRCRHLHMSGWKSYGTYRLELLTEAGICWRLIFKDECYRPDAIPALEGLPVCPGPPEAMLYRIRNPFLSRFLPQLFWFREMEPLRHFQYLLEDLAGTYAPLRTGMLHHMKAARSLGRMQQALRKSFAGAHPDALIRYDRGYSEGLLDYTASNLAEYAARTGDCAVAKLLTRWRDLVSVHQREEFYLDDMRVPIHGDFNKSNIHVHRGDETELKVVDWEWAGVGLPHADLAALAKSVRPEEHPALLQAFVQRDRRADAGQHRRLFHWCQLERGLLDAAFLAKQELAASRRVPWLKAGVSRSVEDVLRSIEWLRSGRTRAAA